MVALYGVIHGAREISIRGERDVPFFVHPKLEASLRRFPRGTKVGIEGFSPEDFSKLEKYLMEISQRNGLGRGGYFRGSGVTYWDSLTDFCRERGFDVVFLEDAEREVDYLRACVLHAKTRHEELVKEETDSEEYYDRKRVERNEREYRARVLMRKTHEIGRERGMLDNVIKNDVEVAIVGLGHSDLWVTKQRELGLNVSSYSTQRMLKGTTIPTFEEDSIPDLGVVYDRESLLREIRFLRTGRVVNERTPDFVGTWELSWPSEGYFEMFITELDGNSLIGVIEDHHGHATFSGEVDDGVFRFTKYYNPGRSDSDATTDFIEYGVKKLGSGFCGYYVPRRGGVGNCVFMTRDIGMPPIEMTLNYNRATDPLIHKVDNLTVCSLWEELMPLLSGEDSCK